MMEEAELGSGLAAGPRRLPGLRSQKRILRLTYSVAIGFLIRQWIKTPSTELLVYTENCAAWLGTVFGDI